MCCSRAWSFRGWAALAALLPCGACSNDLAPLTNRAPQVEITRPAAGTTFDEAESIEFAGAATDREEGVLGGTSLAWSSSLDGVIGTGETLARAGLSPGSHLIELRATDAEQLGGADSVAITVTSAEPPLAGPWVQVPAGSFLMGDGTAFCGVDQRPVTLGRDFWIGRFEVTNEEYRLLLEWAHRRGYAGASATSAWDQLDGAGEELLDLDDPECEIAFAGGAFVLRDAGHGINPRHPVKEVTWFGAAAYCDWLSMSQGLSRAYDHRDWSCGPNDNPYQAPGFRLPTDAEWEYVAQLDDDRIYPWGNQIPTCDLVNYGGCIGWTLPVGSYPEGAQWGLGEAIHDLAGNVWEWCNDRWQCGLGSAPATDPLGPPEGSYRLRRGGGWNSSEPFIRNAYRYDFYPELSFAYFGFRVARSVVPE